MRKLWWSIVAGITLSIPILALGAAQIAKLDKHLDIREVYCDCPDECTVSITDTCSCDRSCNTHYYYCECENSNGNAPKSVFDGGCDIQHSWLGNSECGGPCSVAQFGGWNCVVCNINGVTPYTALAFSVPKCINIVMVEINP